LYGLGHHSSESKVHDIAGLKVEVQELRSEFVDARERLMRMKMESTVSRKLKNTGIGPSDVPPKKIKINSSSN